MLHFKEKRENGTVTSFFIPKSLTMPGISGLKLTLTYKIIGTLGSLLVIFLLAVLVIKLINRRITEPKRQHTTRKITLYIAIFFAILVVSRIWLQQMASVTTIISAVAAGAVLALHQALLNIAGWALIIIRRPYNIGDRVQIGETKGDVIDISLFWTTLFEVGGWVKQEQSTGRMVSCPNSSIFTTQIFNYTKGFQYIWNEISILITFESDWRKAEAIIQKIADEMVMDVSERVEPSMRQMSRRYMIQIGKLTPIVYTTIEDSGVLLTLRYLTNVRQRRTTEVEISRRILEEFAKENNIDFAYPTYRIYRTGEGSRE